MDRAAAEAFIDTLEARCGIVAVVGAGGKKSTLHRLIQAHRIVGTRRIALTTTVKMARAAASPEMQVIVGTGAEVLAAVRSDREAATSVLVAAPSTATGRLSGPIRLAGIAPDLIQRLHAEGRFDVTLVKADGARMRWIKAPGYDEPLLPEGTTTVLPILSARAFGTPVSSKIAHRAERLLNVIDDDIGVELRPHHIARLLTASLGALHRVGDARCVPIINMVDSPKLIDEARQAAKAALQATDRYDRIVLASMSAASPLVEVVTRR